MALVAVAGIAGLLLGFLIGWNFCVDYTNKHPDNT